MKIARGEKSINNKIKKPKSSSKEVFYSAVKSYKIKVYVHGCASKKVRERFFKGMKQLILECKMAIEDDYDMGMAEVTEIKEIKDG